MATYALCDEGNLIASEGASRLDRSDRITIYLTLRDLVRTVSSEAGDFDDLPGFVRNGSRNINAQALASTGNDIELFHDGEITSYRGPISVHIGEGDVDAFPDKEAGSIGRVLPPYIGATQYRHDRELTFSVRLPEAEFEALWRQLGEFRQPVLRTSIRLRAWQHGIDAHFGPDAGVTRFTLLAADNKPSGSAYTPIFGALFHLDDGANPDGRMADLWNGSENALPLDNRPVGQSGEPTLRNIVALLRWALILLGVIAGAVVAMRFGW